MSNKITLVKSIVAFFQSQLASDEVSKEAKESLEVAIQCITVAYDCEASAQEAEDAPIDLESSSGNKLLAEELKTEGNNFMAANKIKEAIQCYTKALELDRKNPVYYCNRAAAYNKMQQFNEAIKDCEKALEYDPTYARAYGRMGLALSSLGNFARAADVYRSALELDPENLQYVNGLAAAREAQDKNVQTGGAAAPGLDLTALFQNEALMSMASSMLSNPDIQNMMASFINSAGPAQGPMLGGLLGQAGQQIAEQIQASNPEMVEQMLQRAGRPPRSSNSQQSSSDQGDKDRGVPK